MNGELDINAQDPIVAVFGFGRRICPGRYLAVESLWIAVALVLATIDIKQVIDQDGLPIIPDGEGTPGLIV